MTKKTFLHLLAKEISGNISCDEKRRLDENLKKNKVLHEVYTETHRFMKPEHNRPAVNVEARLNEVWNRINTIYDENIIPSNNPDTGKRGLLPLWARVAVTVAILLLAGYFAYRMVTPEDLYTETITATDENLYTVLDDGTQVWMGKHSQIAYNKRFGIKNRSIRLSGEAFFDVAHNPAVPLTVLANGVSVTVKGTAFNVNASQPDVEVALIRGWVTVKDMRRKDSPEVLLHPNQKMMVRNGNTVSDNSNYTILSLVQAGDSIVPETRWLNDALVFRKQRFAGIAKLMESRYNVSIDIVNPQLREQCFTGSIKNETLPQMLDALKQSYPFSYEITDKIVIIR